MRGLPDPRIDSTVFRPRANGFNAEMTEPLLDYIVSLPKAELHLHLEGSLEPEMMLALAERNKVEIPYSHPDDVRPAYDYGSLQDFLDLYYAGMSVLRRGEDFEELTRAYLRRAAADGVVHAEVFFDPQAHTARDISFDEVTGGILAGLSAGERKTGATTRLIMCFLRDLSEASAIETFNQAAAYFDDGRIIGIGLDSAEIGNPPEKFARVFAMAGERGLKRVAHAGEEGPASTVRDTLDLLHVDRIDHGIAAVNDRDLMTRLARAGTPLTVCPLSNVALKAVDSLQDHPLKRLLEAGVKVTINSDDPAYFGGYIAGNFLQTARALTLDKARLALIARNSLEASFMDGGAKAEFIRQIDAIQSAN